ncbi:MAG TPA: hypothetical protein VHB21_08885 [Minicystis sp.]|nr:hypothetical protein [Minicystis sp.]
MSTTIASGTPPSCPRRREAIEAAARVAGNLDGPEPGLCVVAVHHGACVVVSLRVLSPDDLCALGLRDLGMSGVYLVAFVDGEAFAVPLRMVPLARGGSC